MLFFVSQYFKLFYNLKKFFLKVAGVLWGLEQQDKVEQYHRRQVRRKACVN